MAAMQYITESTKGPGIMWLYLPSYISGLSVTDSYLVGVTAKKLVRSATGLLNTQQSLNLVSRGPVEYLEVYWSIFSVISAQCRGGGVECLIFLKQTIIFIGKQGKHKGECK